MFSQTFVLFSLALQMIGSLLGQETGRHS